MREKIKPTSEVKPSTLVKDKLIEHTQPDSPVPLKQATRDKERTPESGTTHYIPGEEEVEAQLVEVEKHIRHGNYKAAISAAREVKLDSSNFSSTYSSLVNEKISRAQVAIGDRYLVKGNLKKAKANYILATEPEFADANTKAVSAFTKGIVQELAATRNDISGKLSEMIRKNQYEDWCEAKRNLRDTSILDKIKTFVPDISFEEILGPRIPPHWPPQTSPEGWKDPVGMDDLEDNDRFGATALNRPVAIPNTIFSSLSTKAITLDTIQNFSFDSLTNGSRTLKASATFPLMTSMLIAHARIFALEFGLNELGKSKGSVPIFRYTYLKDKSSRLLKFMSGIDEKMMHMQFELDDYVELTTTIRKHIDEHSAELQALNTLIGELQTTVSALSKGDEELGTVVQQLKSAEDDCDPEWWEYLVAVLVVIGATAIGAGIGFLLGGPVGAVAGGISSLILSIKLTIQVWSDRVINCDNVSAARQDFESAHSALKTALKETNAELMSSLMQRDVIISQLASLQEAYNQAVTNNQSRVLNAKTLSRILGVLDSVRTTNLFRAHSMARMAQEAYNYENDTEVNIIASSVTHYQDKDARGYTASAVLQRDLDGLEHIRLTGKNRKKMQLNQIVSLRKHYPACFGSLLTTGQARFATRLSDFDRWYPGTYLQYLKEVKVEVLLDDERTPIRGYLSNDGVSFVRFSDPGNKIKVDGINILSEPDTDLVKLCFKRRRRHNSVETMAFPSFDSFLYEARSENIQEEERNMFEGCGLESTWKLEFMADQELELSRINDVRISFQYEAMFDPALKTVVEKKRYLNRNETALISVRKLLEDKGATSIDFSKPIEAHVNPFMFEAPHIKKTINDVGFILRPSQVPLMSGNAKLRINYQNQAAIEAETNPQGILAAGVARTAGTNTDQLLAMTKGKELDGTWTIEVKELPENFQAQDLDDILIMVRYSFNPN